METKSQSRQATKLSPTFASEAKIFWDGQQLGFRAYDGTTYFDHQDVLGTERLRSNYSGGVAATYSALPWGDGYTAVVNNTWGDQDNGHFAGLEHDAESGTEHAQFRNYASSEGRWLAPDPYLGSYDLTNPQSFNRYSYALNNSLSLVDPSGLVTCPEGSDGCDTSDIGSDDGDNTNAGGGGDSITIRVFVFDWAGYWASFYNTTYPGFNSFTGLGPATPQLGHGGTGPISAPKNPQQPQKPKCDPLTRLGGAIKALSAAGDAAGSFNLAWVHVAAAGFLIGAGCLEPTPFEPGTCVASGFGGVALLGGATVLTNLGTHQVENEVIPGIKQAVTCTPEGE